MHDPRRMVRLHAVNTRVEVAAGALTVWLLITGCRLLSEAGSTPVAVMARHILDPAASRLVDGHHGEVGPGICEGA